MKAILLVLAVCGACLGASAVYVVAQEKPAAGDSQVAAERTRELQSQVAITEKQVAIKRAAVKVAEAQKKVALAMVASVRAQVVEAQAAESFSEKQYQRIVAMVKEGATTAKMADEGRAQWDGAKARRTAAEREVSQHELRVALEEARIELTHLEVQEAELRLDQLKARLAPKR
jgi:multidrug resistance efflux pump